MSSSRYTIYSKRCWLEGKLQPAGIVMQDGKIIGLESSDRSAHQHAGDAVIMPGIIAGCLLAFVLSLDDFVITQFTAGVGSTTLPLRIYSLVKFGVSPEINALSTLMIVATVAITLVAEAIRRKEIHT